MLGKKGDNTQTTNTLGIAEMEIPQNHSIMERKRKEKIQEICGVQDVLRWIIPRIRKWVSYSKTGEKRNS